MPTPAMPNTPPITPRSSNQALSGVMIVRGLYDTAMNEYNLLNTKLRSRIQDYEIALLKMQLEERDKELHAILQLRNNTQPEKVATNSMLMMEKQEEEEKTKKLIAQQEEQIEKLKESVAVWETHALKARDMLERTYWDLNRVANAEEDVIRRPEN